MVIVCDRCGSRDMSPAFDEETAATAALAMVAFVDADARNNREGKSRCAMCDPTAPKGEASAEGRLRAIWDGKAGS
jgi:hypothetical protein